MADVRNCRAGRNAAALLSGQLIGGLHAALATRPVRYSARCLLISTPPPGARCRSPRRRPARAAVARKGQPWKLAADFPARSIRARPRGGRRADRRGRRRCRAGLLGRLRRRDRGQGADDPARRARAGAGERPHLAGAGMDGPRRGQRLHGRDGAAAGRRRLDLGRARRRSSGPAREPLALASISSVHWSDGGALDMPRIRAGAATPGRRAAGRCHARRRRPRAST